MAICPPSFSEIKGKYPSNFQHPCNLYVPDEDVVKILGLAHSVLQDYAAPVQHFPSSVKGDTKFLGKFHFILWLVALQQFIHLAISGTGQRRTRVLFLEVFVGMARFFNSGWIFKLIPLIWTKNCQTLHLLFYHACYIY